MFKPVRGSKKVWDRCSNSFTAIDAYRRQLRLLRNPIQVLHNRYQISKRGIWWSAPQMAVLCIHVMMLTSWIQGDAELREKMAAHIRSLITSERQKVEKIDYF